MQLSVGEHISVPNGSVQVEPSTGALCATVLTEPAVEIVRNDSSVGLVRIAMPHPDYPAHHIEAGTHGSPNVETTPSGAIQLTYTNLNSAMGTADVEVEVEIESTDRGLRLRTRVRNTGTDVIPQVVFPQIPGLRNVGGDLNTRLQLGRGRIRPFHDIDVRPEDAHYLETHRQRYYPYGNREHSLKWIDYGSTDGGFSLYSCDTRYTTQGVVIERSAKSPEQAALRWVHYPYIEPGETWDSGDFILYPHSGDWYAGARAYQAFARQHYPYRAPVHIREALGIRTIWPAVRGELPTFPLSGIDAYAEEIADPDLGLAELCVWHWWRKNGYPIVVDPRLGTESDLRQALARCRQLDVPVSLFVSHHLVRDEDEVDESRMHHNSAGQRVQQNWTYGIGFVPRFGPPFAGTHSMSQGTALSPGWRQTGLDEYKRILELGATSICFDQFRAWPEPSFNATSDGRPDEEGEKLLEFGRAARSLIHARNPSGTFSGEHITDVKMPVLDYSWEWKNSMEDAGPLRYVFPEFRLNTNVNEHPRGSLKGFMEGALLNVIPGDMRSFRLRDCPELVVMLKKLAALRKRFLPYFTDGQFRFMEGLTVEGGEARLYTHGDRIMVIAINASDEPATVSISVDPNVWGDKVVNGHLTRCNLDGIDVEHTTSGSSAFARRLTLAPDTLEIIEFTPEEG